MIQKSILFFLLFSWGHLLFGQELIPFYDREKDKWGFQDKINGKVMIQAQFDFASAWWTDYGIVMIDGKYGLIDRSGQKVSPFKLDIIEVKESADAQEKSGLWSYYNYEEGVYLRRYFRINSNCDCVPQKYYPCPPMVKMDTSQTTFSLLLIQRAEKYYHKGEITKALDFADKAIKLDTNDASAYFWKAAHLADIFELIIMPEPDVQRMNLEQNKEAWDAENVQIEKILKDRLSSSQSDHISEEEFKTEMAKLDEEKRVFEISYAKKLRSIDSLQVYYDKWREESNNYFNTKYDTSYHLKEYYDLILRKTTSPAIYQSTLAMKWELNYLSSDQKSKIKHEILKKVDRFDRKSEVAFSIHAGFTVSPFQKAEINVTFNPYHDFVFSNAFPNGVGAGIGYERGIDVTFESYKLFAYLQPIGPIHIALNFLYSKNDRNSGIGFRPEFGFNFSALTVLYGYNVINKSNFSDAHGNMVGIRVQLPIWRKNQFRKNFGNNLYRS